MSIYIAQPNDTLLAANGDEQGFRVRLKAAIESRSGIRVAESAEQADLVIISECWRHRDWRHIELIAACPFLQQHSRKIVVVSHRANGAVFFPGLYTSLTPKNRWKNWSEPSGYKGEYEVAAPTHSPGDEQARLLFSFRGADFTHPVRQALTGMLKQPSEKYRYTVINKKFGSHSESERLDYIRELQSSLFVLAPRGRSPSSYRLFEAMQYGRCPVIVSDEWQAPADVDWEACSIRLPEQEIDKLIPLLEEKKAEALVLGEVARRLWEENFSDFVREKHMLNMLISLHQNCQQDRSMGSLVKLWQSKRFHSAHDWSITVKAKTNLIRWRDALRSAVAN